MENNEKNNINNTKIILRINIVCALKPPNFHHKQRDEQPPQVAGGGSSATSYRCELCHHFRQQE